MKKLYALLGAVTLGATSAMADVATGGAYTPSTTVNTDVVTGTGGVLQSIADYIGSAVNNAWPIIIGIVGVGILIWLGRAMLRAVRAYFSTSM